MAARAKFVYFHYWDEIGYNTAENNRTDNVFRVDKGPLKASTNLSNFLHDLRKCIYSLTNKRSFRSEIAKCIFVVSSVNFICSHYLDIEISASEIALCKA